MLRKIVDYKKLNRELATLLIETYPDGYGDEDIIAFKNIYGEMVEAVELKTDDILYLIKISKSLANFISNFEDNIEKELEAVPKLDSNPILIGIELNNEVEIDEDMYFE